MQILIVLSSLVSELVKGSKFPAVPPPKLELPWKKYILGVLVESTINYVNFV